MKKYTFNISQQTIDFLNENYIVNFSDSSDMFKQVDYKQADELTIMFDKDGNYIYKRIKATKKELTIQDIVDKINKDNVYYNFTKSFNKLIELDGFNCYPTTYGIGIFVLFGRKPESIEKITNKLDSLGIEYKNEYSDAGWVYRFRISQSKENINKINNFINSK